MTPSEIKAIMIQPLQQIFKLQVMPIVYYVATKSKAIAFYRQITLNGIGSARRKKLQSFYLQNIQAIHTTVYLLFTGWLLAVRKPNTYDFTVNGL